MPDMGNIYYPEHKFLEDICFQEMNISYRPIVLEEGIVEGKIYNFLLVLYNSHYHKNLCFDKSFHPMMFQMGMYLDNNCKMLHSIYTQIHNFEMTHIHIYLYRNMMDEDSL